MTILGLQKVTLLDYPGKVASTIFTYGCDFRCPFCHNPELVNLPQDKELIITEEEVLNFLKKRVGKIDALVVTGGEPMLHKDLLPFIRKIKDLGFLVKLDTNGTFPDRLEKALESRVVDYVAMDIKSSFEGYSTASGVNVDIDAIQTSIELLKRWKNGQVEFRTTFVKGLHTEKECNAIGHMVEGVSTFSIQNFRAGKTISSTLSKENQFSIVELQEFRKILVQYVKNVEIKNIF